MARTRRTYTPEFKAEAVKLVTEQGYSVAEAARSRGLRENLIRNWKQALQVKGEHTFPGNGKLKFDENGRRDNASLLIVQWQKGVLVTIYPAKDALSPPLWPKQ